MKSILFISSFFILLGCTITSGDVTPDANLKGKVKSIKYGSTSGSSFYLDNFEYNSSGLVSKSSRYDQDNKLTDELTIVRNGDNLITSTSFGSPNGIKFTRTFKYNEMKKLVSEDNRNFSVNFEYGNDGNISKTKTVSKSSQNTTEATYKWISDNLSTITYSTGVASFTKYDDKSNPFYQLYIKDLGISGIFISPENWSKNNIISLKSSAGYTYNYVYEYDAEGKVIKQSDGNSIITFTYF